MRSSAVAAMTLVAVTAALTVAAGAAKPTQHPAPLVKANAVGSTLVCPDLQNVHGDEVATTLTAGTTVSGTGKTELFGVASSKEPHRDLLDHGPAVKRYKSSTSGPVVVQTTGAITGGIVATQLTRGRLTDSRGYAETACTPPLTDQWFVGAATTVGAASYIQLVNVEDFSALVNVTIYTPEGQADAPGGSNIVVPARNAVKIDLDTLAPEVKMTAIEVTTATGRVAAAVRDTHTHGATALGTDWVPLVRAPQHQVTIPGIPSNGDPSLSSTRLAIANPGESDTTVQVQAISTEGDYVPVGLDYEHVPVKGGAVTIVDLTKKLNGMAAAVQVTSSNINSPVVAGVVVDANTRLSGIHELMFLGAQTPLAGETYLPEIRVAPDVISTLYLTAPDQAVDLTLQFDLGNSGRLAAGRSSLSTRVHVNAGRTAAIDLGKYVTGAATALILVDSGSGPVYAVRFLYERGARGPLISALAAVNAQPPVEVPAVRRDLDVWQRP